MHELGIATSILRATLATAEEHGGLRVLSVRVRVGELAQVMPDALVFSFEQISRNTLAEAARLDVIGVPLVWVCDACSARSDTQQTACAACGSRETHREGAHQILLESIEMEDEEAEVPHG